MNKIEVLDLDIIAEEIVRFYDSERSGYTNYQHVRGLLEDWSYSKYELFEKMGNRLIVSSSEVVTKDLSIQDDFVEMCISLKNSHLAKTLGSAPMNDSQKKHALIAKVLGNLHYLGQNKTSNIYKIVENKGFEDNQDILDFVLGVCSGSYGFRPEAPKWNKQVKLTKQFSAVAKDLVEYTREDIERGKEEDGEITSSYKNRHLEELMSIGECFNIALSEIKQGMSRNSEDLEFFVSIHPFDFVTASYNKQGWTSCYTPSNSHAKSVFSLLSDSVTAITYVPSRKQFTPEYAVELNSKKMRAWLHFDSNLKRALVSKAYPADYKEYVEAIAQTLEKTGVVKSYRLTEENLYDQGIEFSESMYCDLANLDYATMITETETGKENGYWDFGRDVACMGCGDMSNTLDNQGSGDDSDLLSAWTCMTCEYGENFFCCPRCSDYYPEEERAGDENSHCYSCQSDIENFFDIDYEGCGCHLCEEREFEVRQEMEEEEKREEEELREDISSLGGTLNKELQEKAERDWNTQRAKNIKDENIRDKVYYESQGIFDRTYQQISLANQERFPEYKYLEDWRKMNLIREAYHNLPEGLLSEVTN